MMHAQIRFGTPRTSEVVNIEMEKTMKKIITANDLNGVNNQNEAGNTLRNLLKGVSPGDAEIHTEATLVMAKNCPALAMTIRQAIDNWNKGRHSIISVQPETQH
jgi:hypothetical protein